MRDVRSCLMLKGPFVVAPVMALVIACGATPHRPPPEIYLTFDKGSAGSALSDPILNSGSFGNRISVSVVSLTGGSVLTITHLKGDAIRLPAYQPGRRPPRAILKIVNARGVKGDRLSPGISNFTFGADFKMDRFPTAAPHSRADDGDNLIQRGLFRSASQYKIELDSRRPVCTLHGTSGDKSYIGKLDVSHLPGFPKYGVWSNRWYRVRCQRTSPTSAKLTVIQFAPDGSVARSWVDDTIEPAMPSAPAVDIQSPATTPMSVGGKLTVAGRIVTAQSSDQFNGLVDNVVFQLD
jgi:hypothetical protein